ncbi:hypothetical protein [Halobellus ordinarius]|uniref:hypothetical protein n=1 Tax=Halobellus ordinarius TaxID=3075120 RepID=UPI0028804210|nr:hypothetical protein [Halobellus sp. ZY16]
MTGTDPAIGPEALYLGGTIAGGFATVALMLAIALTDSFTLVAIAGLLPIVITIAAAHDYGGREALDAALQPHADEPEVES